MDAAAAVAAVMADQATVAQVAAVQGARAGSIVLMHDIHPTTVDAADCVIDGLPDASK